MKKNKLVRVVFMMLPMLLLSFLTYAQTGQVRGIVTDENGSPIPGANVVVKGTTNGNMTDLNGRYQVNADSKSTLVFTFIGYKAQEVHVANQKQINVKLVPDNLQLNEVVVVGYGTMKKSDLSGAVSSVRSDALKNLSTSDAAAAIQGKVSGVQVLSNSGAPGQGASIRVRGYSSNSGSIGPLLIVDGLKVDNIQYLDPSMIERCCFCCYLWCRSR
jgi:hypothetical protein